MSLDGYSYVATQVIDIDGVRAFNPGDLVPDSTVAARGWDEGDAKCVAKADSKAAAEVPGAFDPTTHSVEEVNAHLEGADSAELARVLDAEQTGKARTGILSGPHAAQA